MKKTILVSISIVFVFSFGIFFVLLSYFPDTSSEIDKHDFFKQTFDPKYQKIFLLGSSHVGTINTPYVMDKVSNFSEYHVVYNLAYDSDSPEKRFNSLEEMILLKPEIIFYGISFRDFETNTKQDNLLPSPKDITELLPISEINNINPRLVTLKAIKNFFNYSDVLPESERKIILPNTPFTAHSIAVQHISNNEELQKEIPSIISQKKYRIIDLDGIKYQKFIDIIERLEGENIKLIIFTTPLHPEYVNQISINEKNNFKQILENISNNYDIKIYNFMTKYDEQNIWNNLSHISVSDDAIIFSDDISNMIISEIGS